ncbi:MAG: M3 family oligoendopeptidase [Rhodobacteraceae bacterium]|nr:M3 family oligoendopeptidase [Paracoccaceae bacterium]
MRRPRLSLFPRISTAPCAQADGAGKPDSTALGPLPRWDLGDLYPAPDAPALTRDLTWVQDACADFAAQYQGKLAQLEAGALLRCIQRNEEIHQTSQRIMSYAGLRYAQQTTDAERAQFLSNCQEKLTESSSALVFFTLELNRLEEDHLTRLCAENADLAHYAPMFRRIRALKPYQLSDEMEKLLHDLGATGDAWERLFDETIAGLTFRVKGKTLSIEAALNLLSDPMRTTRKAAAQQIARVLGQHVKTFARIHNTQAKEKEILDRWRRFPSAQMGRHLANQVEPEVVQALRDAVVAAYPRLSHRYYDIKRRWMGLRRMQIWDRNAPLPTKDTRLIPWDEAQKTVLAAYESFDPRLAEIARPFFAKGWIDAPAQPGKAPGAFAHPTVTNVHPYLLMNYLGKPRDVMTLAHELGHGVHQVLAAAQGEFLSATPLTLAETASVFGEMLTFRRLLASTTTPAARKVLLAGKVGDMINTVVRQIAFYDFECKLHAARRDGELTPKDINALWMSVQAESLGPAFDFAKGYESFWCYIPHFVHSPFYVYAYAFGDGLVNALYAVYEEGQAGFQDQYFAMLKAGGAKHHKELLAPFGLDASDPAFWDRGLNMIAGLIDELEAMPA